MTTTQHELFMVFVDGKHGLEQEYAAWFTGVHMADMERLPGVASARAFHLQTLDREPVPAGLCAVYETPNGAGLLQAIGASKGTDALPVSDIQGQMIWRVLEPVRLSVSQEQIEVRPRILICMFGGDWDQVEEDRLWDWLDSAALPMVEARQTRISPVQPMRGREYGGVLFLALSAGADEGTIVSVISRHRDTNLSRFLLAHPV